MFPSAANWHATVLVVDDDAATAGRIAKMVETAGHAVRVASTWTDALRIYKGEKIDLVLMDAVMPGMDGFKLTQLLRNSDESYVPVVFVTGLEDRKTRELCMHAGADDLLIKPVDALELSLRLTAMLRIRRLTLDLEEKGRVLEQMAHLDPLTGVPNRRAFEDAVARELTRSQRYGHPLCLIVGDVDHFKSVNDTYGHAAGDEVLRQFGAVMRRHVKRPEVAFRYGGEEFVVLAPEMDSRSGAALADRLRRAFHEASAESAAGAQTVSFGVCDTTQIPEDADAGLLFASADRALYLAKEQGRNRVVRADTGRERDVRRAA